MTPLVVNDETKISVVVTDRRQDYDRLRLPRRMLDSVVDAVTAVDPDGTDHLLERGGGAAVRLAGLRDGRPDRSIDTVDTGVTEDERPAGLRGSSSRRRDVVRGVPGPPPGRPLLPRPGDQGAGLRRGRGARRGHRHEPRHQRAEAGREGARRERGAVPDSRSRTPPTVRLLPDRDLRYTWVHDRQRRASPDTEILRKDGRATSVSPRGRRAAHGPEAAAC